MNPFFYLKVSIGATLVWLFIFLRRKPEQRKEMLFMSIIFGFFGPIQELWYIKDYWHPVYLGSWPWVEDILFAFSMAGIASILYEIAFQKRETVGENPHPFVFLSAAFVGAIGGIALFSQFMNSIYAGILGFVLAWLMVIIFRRDLFIPSLCSAFLMFVLTVVGYSIALISYPTLIHDWWYLKGLSGIFFLRIPIEEYLWFSSLGLLVGPLYDILKGIKLVNSKN